MAPETRDSTSFPLQIPEIEAENSEGEKVKRGKANMFVKIKKQHWPVISRLEQHTNMRL